MRSLYRYVAWLVSIALITLVNGCSPKPEPPPPPDFKQAPVETQAATTPAAEPLPPSPAPPEPKSEPNPEAKPEPTAEAPKKTAFDPIKVNGPIFKDWSPPKLAIVITGEQLGYIEPCGCAGLENQKGGLSRRHTLLKELKEKGWPILPVDLGGVINRFGKQAELKFQNAVDALKLMDYAAVGWGPTDLRLPAGELISAVTDTDAPPSRFVSANVALFGFEAGLTPRFRVVEAGGKKIGITGALGDAQQKQVNNADVTFAPAEKSLEEVLPQFADKCDLRILLSYAEPEESAKLAKRFPQFQIVVTAGGADEPPNEPRKVEGTDTLLIELGHKGMFAVVLGLYDDPQKPVRYQRVALDSRFGDSPQMRQVMVNYQHQLTELGWDGLGLRPKPHARATASGDPLGQFVGSAECGKCHQKAFDVWTNTPHAHATDSLVNAKPPRQFDPECVSCHVTGWNPQQFFPYESGFLSLAKTPHLAGNGCENCHGPGAAHVTAENAAGDAANRDKLRALMRVSKGTSLDNACTVCHDLDNSPKFDFNTWWPQVEHKGKD